MDSGQDILETRRCVCHPSERSWNLVGGNGHRVEEEGLGKMWGRNGRVWRALGSRRSGSLTY